ncbi:hypothetical protein GCM10017655_53120 [Pseudomonas turukhanskensis]|uniref:Uncharacterized protein n=1 Tax=Pseudomonas turukhanskensis TaxID=1806536 RepID=A0A9W6NIR6_9PSED|nr:hypothetical protein GCM10017655_53120 [Pseudomonas turukhanskensis]
MAAAKAALNAGHRIIEIDAALTGPSNSMRKVFLGHYFSMSAAGGPAKTTPHHLTPAELVKFKMRKRDQSLSFDEDDHLPLLSELLTWAMENQVLLMIDPKTPGSTLAHEHDRIIAYSLNEARTLGALANVAIKNVNRHNWTLIGIKPYLDGPFSDYDGQFLWSPIVNKSMAFEKDETLASINSWHKATQNSKQVITYETSLYNPTFWAATPFVEQGKNYLNLIDYVKQLTPLGKRSAVWSIDPVGDKGTLDREYRWKFSGNSDKDKRGNPFRNISYELGRHVVINTDRPDWYEQMVVNPY